MTNRHNILVTTYLALYFAAVVFLISGEWLDHHFNRSSIVAMILAWSVVTALVGVVLWFTVCPRCGKTFHRRKGWTLNFPSYKCRNCGSKYEPLPDR